jgi:hypothetical protein
VGDLRAFRADAVDMLVDAAANLPGRKSGGRGTMAPTHVLRPYMTALLYLQDRHRSSFLFQAACTSHVRSCARSFLASVTCHYSWGTSIIRAHSHLQHLHISSTLRLALDQLVQTLERSRLHQTDGLPLGADSVLTLDVLHQAQYRILYCA